MRKRISEECIETTSCYYAKSSLTSFDSRLYAFLNDTDDDPSGFLPMPTFIPERDFDDSPPASLYQVGETDWARDSDSLDGASFKDFNKPFSPLRNPAIWKQPNLIRSATFSFGGEQSPNGEATAGITYPKIKKGFFRKFW